MEFTFYSAEANAGDKLDIQNKKVNVILCWRMMNATEEKKAEKGVGERQTCSGEESLQQKPQGEDDT